MGASHSAPTPDVDDVQSLDQLPSARTATGEDFDFKSTRNKVTLVVNVASACGLTTKNYADFASLQDRFGDDLVILAFPCNQFLFQESGSSKSICAFAQKRGFKGTVFEKCKVNGKAASHVFRWLKRAQRVRRVQWNFGKFLVGRKGRVRGYFSPHTRPMEFEDAIKALLDEPVDADAS